jgi:hypothetical protein
MDEVGMRRGDGLMHQRKQAIKGGERERERERKSDQKIEDILVHVSQERDRERVMFKPVVFLGVSLIHSTRKIHRHNKTRVLTLSHLMGSWWLNGSTRPHLRTFGRQHRTFPIGAITCVEGPVMFGGDIVW